MLKDCLYNAQVHVRFLPLYPDLTTLCKLGTGALVTNANWPSRLFHKQLIVGSTPTVTTKQYPLSLMEKPFATNEEDAGSSPVVGSKSMGWSTVNVATGEKRLIPCQPPNNCEYTEGSVS